MNDYSPNFDYLLWIYVYVLAPSIKETVTPHRNSSSPPETFTQQINTPGTVTILQGAMMCFFGWHITKGARS